MSRTLAWTSLLCLLLLCAPSPVRARTGVAQPPAQATATAFVELVEEGFPGPGLEGLTTWVLLRPFELMAELSADARGLEELRLRACTNLARAELAASVRAIRLTGGEGVRQDALTSCRAAAAAIHDHHPFFCSAAAMLSAAGGLSETQRGQVTRRCPAELEVLVSLERLVRDPGRADPVPRMEADATPTPLVRRYVAALQDALLRLRAVAAERSACLERGRCSLCGRALRHAWLEGTPAEAEELAGKVAALAGDPCRRERINVLAWRQQWDRLSAGLDSLAQPWPGWAWNLALYRDLQQAAAGTAGTTTAAVRKTAAEALADSPDGPLRQLAVEALLRTAAAFRQETTPESVTGWLVGAALAPEVTAAGDAAVGVALAFLWALADAETVVPFMDEALRRQELAVKPRVRLRVAQELLTLAVRTMDAERVLQAKVLLERILDGPREDPALVAESEAFFYFAEWMDRSLEGKCAEGMRRYVDHQRDLLARLPPDAPGRLRSMVALNLLAGTLCRRRGTLHELDSYLGGVSARNTAFYVLWIHQFLETRRTARARAALEWCLRDAEEPVARAACLAWGAYMHELAGEQEQAADFLRQADELLSGSLEDALRTGNLVLSQGERRVGFSLMADGELRLAVDFSPAFFLVPLPRLDLRAPSVSP